MSLQGPFLVVADHPSPELVRSIERAGGYPVVEAGWDEAIEAVRKVEPSAVILGSTELGRDLADGLAAAIGALSGPVAPVVALVNEGSPRHLSFLPLRAGNGGGRLIACLRAALRVRTQHAAVLRRSPSAMDGASIGPARDPLDDAVVLVAGRGRCYPGLTTAIGARAGLIGALSLEGAYGFLEAREVDALVIGDGFNRRAVAGFIERLEADPRFRDLPIAACDHLVREVEYERLPFFQEASGAPDAIAEDIMPYARLHALSARLKRMNAALDAKGAVDPDTGLFTREAFVRDFTQAVKEAEAQGVALSLARFSFEQAGARERRDASRLVSRLIRMGDFACRDRDGSILLALTATDLGAAHVVARRLASVLKHTMLSADPNRTGLAPDIALASLKHRDTPTSLLGRVTPERLVAAE